MEEVRASDVHDESDHIALTVLESAAGPYDDSGTSQRRVDEGLTAHHLDE